ncbi:MAG: hypothetical protein WBZ36_15405 [Candidatus Nitrosopolaris sp.]
MVVERTLPSLEISEFEFEFDDQRAAAEFPGMSGVLAIRPDNQTSMHE